ncbi:hypothetical protein RF11_05219 [Thelohanellus kitauei]|uniref:Uncharacterized protein n=1 Tax=Thelohanellus kitauei TaxID=669202 RepID=A0A0C2J0K7_THEKT|nr:hypothetical protein RF11_05219 [Thelohanellus kitauei]
MDFKFDVSEDAEKQLDLLDFIALLKGQTPRQKAAQLIMSLPEEVRSNLTDVKTILCDVKQESNDILKDELRIHLKIFFPPRDQTKLLEDAKIRLGESIPIFAMRMKSLKS